MNLDYDTYAEAMLALLVWREARGELHPAKVAVAFSVLNRVAHPKWWGTSLGAVIAKKWQYSSMAAPGDPNLIQYPLPQDVDFQDSLAVVNAVIANDVTNPVPGSDSYYDVSIAAPTWAKPEQFVKQVGAFRFYNTDGDHPENAGT
ncbi:MAG: cell wall hydrolase [Betaproteobacteria bacterium]|nr:cell wall hydrolase [Betaproteobacteria bacterium]